MYYLYIYVQCCRTRAVNSDATPRNQAECEKNIFEVFAVLESTHCPDHFDINFMKNGLILPELQPIENKCICN